MRELFIVAQLAASAVWPRPAADESARIMRELKSSSNFTYPRPVYELPKGPIIAVYHQLPNEGPWLGLGSYGEWRVHPARTETYIFRNGVTSRRIR